MSARMKRNWDLLRVLQKAPKAQRDAIIRSSSDDLVLAICEIIVNVLNGTVRLTPAQRKKLTIYKKILRSVADRKLKSSTKKRLLIQKGGFLPAILTPVLAVVASLIGETIGSALRK